MGIINITPDSFFADSRAGTIKEAVEKSIKMLEEGADILDIGGFSTRPGSQEVSFDNERERAIPVIEAIIKEVPQAIISIDSFRTELVREAIDKGASIINDITAGQEDGMFELAASSKLPYVMMHMRGPISRMMENTNYTNLEIEITNYFQERVTKLKELGCIDMILDPGFGFSKSLDQNYEILKNLSYFEVFEHPILVGVSRKSMIYKYLNTTAANALNGTSVLNFEALQKGARILRVHDVKEAVETIKLYKKIAC